MTSTIKAIRIKKEMSHAKISAILPLFSSFSGFRFQLQHNGVRNMRC